MSAYIVEDITINRVVSFIAQQLHPTRVSAVELAANVTLSTDEGLRALGGAMFLLNCRAVDARYPDHATNTPDAFRPQDFAFRDELVDQMQAYKSLECWLYQCSEGDIPSSPLYIAFDNLRDEMARHIVQALPAYSAAKWE